VTTVTLPHGHTATRPARRGLPAFTKGLLLALTLAAALPAVASNPAPVDLPAAQTAATQAPLDAVAPVDLASPDNAPLAAQIAALQDAQSAPTTSVRVKTVLQRAFALLGTPYRWGGTSPERGFDCSGLVGYVFRTIGIDLPRVSRAMVNEGTAIADRNALTEGDLVFFGKRGRVDHVGIYIGEGKFLHAPRTGRNVTVSSLSTGYWSAKYLEARRLATGS
jgi:cell wall-associated NlpC family hydrolase